MQFTSTIRRFAGAAAIAAGAAIVLAPSLRAQVSGYGDKQMGPANQKSAILSKVGIAQHLNQQLPLNLTFTDDAGQQYVVDPDGHTRCYGTWLLGDSADAPLVIPIAESPG